MGGSFGYGDPDVSRSAFRVSPEPITAGVVSPARLTLYGAAGDASRTAATATP